MRAQTAWAGIAWVILAALPAFGDTVTANPNVPVPDKVNLVFNRSATLDAGNTSGWSSTLDVALRPSTGVYAQAGTGSTGQTYALEIGGAYDVGTVEFIFGRWAWGSPNNYIPATFNLYAAPSDVANLYQAAYKIADDTSAGITYDDRSPAGDGGFGMKYQRLRYDLPAAQSLYKFGLEVTSWQALGNGSDARAFILAASAHPENAPLAFDGEIGVLNNTWNPGATLSASDTLGGNIAATPVYDVDDWTDPRWFGRYDPSGTGTKLLTVTQHLADTYDLTGVRWAAGQTNWPTEYQVFAANYDGAGQPAAGDWVAVTGLISGANRGDLVSFDSSFVGNWIRIDATDGNTSIWENTKWQVYGGVAREPEEFIPEPGTLALLSLSACGLLVRRRRNAKQSRQKRRAAMKTTSVLALCLAVVLCGLWAAPIRAAEVTANPNVPVPDKVNLVFNRSATRDAGNTSGYSNTLDIVFSPSTLQWAGASPTQTGQTYAINIGQAYNVGALEFLFARYPSWGGTGNGNNFIPGTFNLYAAPSDVANLYQAAYKVADETTASYVDRGTGFEGFGYQQIRYDLPAAQSVQKFGLEVTSWQGIGSASDYRAFLVAASAFPENAPLAFDGEIGVLNNTWNPGATLSASDTLGGNITAAAVYDADDWADPRWFGRYDPYNTGTELLTVTQHLADTYELTGVRWACGQSNWPTEYQVFAANYDGAGQPAAGDWVAVTGVISGGNRGDLVPFDSSFVGNWIRIDATDGNSTLWENTKWQVYGGVAREPEEVIPEPATLALLGIGGLGLLVRRRRNAKQSRQTRRAAMRAVSVLALCLLALAVLAGSALAAPVAVTDYNWLQLPPADVTPLIGGGAGGGSGYGEPADFRWGDWVWIPNGTLTADGGGMYWAAVKLDEARNVKNVWTQWWSSENALIQKFYLDASNDGTTWTNIGSHDYGSMQTGARFRTNVDVSDGTYEYVRIRMEPGDYTYGSGERGGPGLLAIEPMGDGTVAPDKVNWANASNFATTVANNGFTFNGTRYNDGFLYDDETARTGQLTDWDAGDFVEIQFDGQTRSIDEVVVVWDSNYNATTFDVEYSANGTDFFPVTGALTPVLYTGPGATGIQFDAVDALAVRVTNAAGGYTYSLLNQVLVYGPAPAEPEGEIPEPATLALLGIGGLGLLLRKRRTRTAKVLAISLFALGSCLCASPAAAANFTGDYKWLTYYHTSLDQTATYHTGPGSGPGKDWQWIGSRANTGDHWREIEWDRTVRLTGAIVAADAGQFQGGSIGTYKLQSSADGSTGWTDVPTSTTLSGTARFDVTFTTPVDGKALRVLFPQGSYDQGTGGHGPGVSRLIARGNYADGLGIDPTDPEFNILAAPGFLGTSPVVTFAHVGNPPNENSPHVLNDNDHGQDGPRAGWHPPMNGSESIVCDLGVELMIGGVRLYGGTHYSYLPASMDVHVTNDLGDWGSAVGTMAVSDGWFQASGLSAVGQYVILTNPPTNSSYILPNELFINAFEPPVSDIPEPGTLALLGIGGLGLLLRRRRSARQSRQTTRAAMRAVSILAVFGVALAGSALAAPVAVTDYNWLQIPDNVISGVGNPSSPFNTSGYSGYANPTYPRWGANIWIPDGALTNSGRGDYWAAIELDEVREVENVWVQFWAHEGTSVRRVRIEGSPDGTTFTQIGLHDYGSFQTGSKFRVNVDVTDGNYRYIRARFNGTDSQPGDADYTFGNAGRGGPGVYVVEPLGDGTLAGQLVNWANQANFGTGLANNGLDFNGNQYLNGLLFDNGVRTGDTVPWEAGDYAQIDLGVDRTISRSILVWEHMWGAQAYTLEYSTDGSTFQAVTGLSAPIYHASYQYGATEYTFDPVTAQWFRITDGSGNQHTIFNQVMLYSPEFIPEPIPEPATLALLGIGGLGLLLRRRKGAKKSRQTRRAAMRAVSVLTVFVVALVGLVTFAASPAAAETWNTGGSQYNWNLDKRATCSTNGGVGYGTCSAPNSTLVNGMRIWIPSSASTGNGNNSYYCEVDLGEVRPIARLRTATYHEANIWFDRVVAQFSPDGSDWSQQQVLYDNASVPITSGWTWDSALSQTYNARYVRLEFPAGRYGSDGHSGYGGPGVYTLASFSPTNTDVTVDGNFDLALNAFTGTPITGMNLDFGPASVLGDGVLYSSRAGDANPWDGYVQVTLPEAYMISGARINWDYGEWHSDGLKLQFSTDGIDFSDEISFTDAAVIGDGNHAAVISFDPHLAQYVRWVNTAGTPSYTLSHEFILYGEEPSADIPEPATLALLGVGGLGVLLRRRRRA